MSALTLTVEVEVVCADCRRPLNLVHLQAISDREGMCFSVKPCEHCSEPVTVPPEYRAALPSAQADGVNPNWRKLESIMRPGLRAPDTELAVTSKRVDHD